MPNLVKNKVRAKNTEDTKKLIAMLVRKNDEGKDVTNFNGIIPMPKELMDTVAGCISEENDRKREANKEKYGFRDWYDFANAKWGTKWDALAIEINGNVIEFESAWCIPSGVYEEISKTIPILVAYADEDIGSNCGLIEVVDGEIYDCEHECSDAQLANAVWGYEYEGEEYQHIDDYSEDAKKEVNNFLATN